MIEKLKGFLEQDQIDGISKKITDQMFDYLREKNTPAERKFASKFQRPEYSPHNKEPALKWALQSAFPENEEIAGLSIRCLKDEGGYIRTELTDDRIVVLLVFSETSLSAKYFKKYCRMNENWPEDRRFCYYFCSLTEKWISSIELRVPDANGAAAPENCMMLYDRPPLKEASV